MRSACVLGLTWTALLAGVAAGAAQTTPERPLPPIRLPGIVYPDQTEAAPMLPELGSKGRRSQPPAAPVTPASPPDQRGIAVEPLSSPRTGPLTVRTEAETTAAVIVASKAAKWVEPLAPPTHGTQHFISPEAVTARGFVLAVSFGLACASLGSALLAFVRRRQVWAS
jgi:hypothetical protein